APCGAGRGQGRLKLHAKELDEGCQFLLWPRGDPGYSEPVDRTAAKPAGERVSSGDTPALGEQVYAQLRAIADEEMRGERAGHTLQTTALVNEVYLRLAKEVDRAWAVKGQFFAAAAEAMRRILIEHARGRAAAKRGGDRARVPLDWSFDGV